MYIKSSVCCFSVIALSALVGCATAPKYQYGATANTNQQIIASKAGDVTLPRLISKQKNIMMAEPRVIACDGQTEFAFNVVIANKQDYPIKVAPTDFNVIYDGRTFPAMSEQEVEKVIHQNDWEKDSMLALGIIGGIAGAASGNLAASSNLLIQGATNYQTIDNEQNAEMEKYRNKVLATKSIEPKGVYGGLIIARRDQAGHNYAFESTKFAEDIDLVVDIDGQTDTLSFNCRGPANLNTVAQTSGAGH